jgi:hypothetical protein
MYERQKLDIAVARRSFPVHIAPLRSVSQCSRLHWQRARRRLFVGMANGRACADSGLCACMKSEIAELVELLARSVYQRWRAGELLPDAAPPQACRPQKNQPQSAPLVAYDPSGHTPAMELLGCASTLTPGTTQTGR